MDAGTTGGRAGNSKCGRPGRVFRLIDRKNATRAMQVCRWRQVKVCVNLEEVRGGKSRPGQRPLSNCATRAYHIDGVHEDACRNCQDFQDCIHCHEVGSWLRRGCIEAKQDARPSGQRFCGVSGECEVGGPQVDGHVVYIAAVCAGIEVSP